MGRRKNYNAVCRNHKSRTIPYVFASRDRRLKVIFLSNGSSVPYWDKKYKMSTFSNNRNRLILAISKCKRMINYKIFLNNLKNEI